jgi:hypothetical protein
MNPITTIDAIKMVRVVETALRHAESSYGKDKTLAFLEFLHERGLYLAGTPVEPVTGVAS